MKPATPPRKAVALAFFTTAATSTLAGTSGTAPFFCFTAVLALEAVTEAVARVTDAVLAERLLRTTTRLEPSSWGRRACCLRISRRA